ncbi:MAG: phage minor capsid protein [Christensenellaceae bacterium]|nr:phage minor capsid protein [Christensenellaceae bacterium]MEA5067153.1 phage minor capsid protein [Eubacteriales bacterium]MEA5067845.1 phage minor capsid protein [Christensenellaceae bacterium]
MLSERQLQGLLKIFEDRSRALTTAYLTKMGDHLRTIGQLMPSDVNRLVELKRMGANVEWVKGEIAKAMGAAARDVENVLYQVAEHDYRVASRFYAEGRQIPIKQNPALMRILRAQAKQTAGEMTNLARTTVVSGAYKDAVSEAIQAAQSGVGDYNSAIRRAVKATAGEGLRVEYESGHARRLDTAVRMNVLDGVRQLNQDVARQTGKEFGADGVELSAHALCAEDHLPYQGLQFTNRQYAEIQATLDRPIGQWNCKHFAFPILFGVSRPAYTQAQLDDFKRNSEARITIDGRTMTRYEWSQEQRRIETAIRQRKDVAIMAKASGDDMLRREAQAAINQYQNGYRRISEQAGLYERFDKTRVAGFRAVNTNAGLKSPVKRDMIDPKKRDDEIRALIRSDATNKKINAGHQDKHLIYSDHYVEGRSYVYGVVDHAQAIVDKYHGTGEPRFSRTGKWSNREVITADHDIGVEVDKNTGVKTSTNRATIHYGKRGAHVVPARRQGP